MKPWKIILIITAVLVVIGLGLVVGAYAAGGSFEIKKVTTNTYYAEETVQRIVIHASGQEVTVQKSDTDQCYVVCDESENIRFAVKTENGTLTVTEQDARQWYDHIGIFSRAMKVTVYLPEGVYEELSVTASGGSIVCQERSFVFTSAYITTSSGGVKLDMQVTSTLSVKLSSGSLDISNCSPETLSVFSGSGSIHLTDCSSNRLSVRASSGSVALTNSRSGSVISECTSGSVKLTNVVCQDKIQVKSTSGSIKLESCDAPAVELSANSGSIRATLLTGKVFDVHSDSGKINYPPSDRAGGSCTAETDSGSIRIEVTAG